MNLFVDFTDINLLKTHDRAHSYELGVTRRPFREQVRSYGLRPESRADPGMAVVPRQAPPIVPMLRVGMPFWTLCVLYSSSRSTFDTLSTKKSTLCRVVHIGGLIFRMFR